jgi:predicted small metal-binding protein
MRIICPVCYERISGESESELTSNLQDHMVREHDLEDVCVLKDRSGAEGKVERSIKSCDLDVVREDVRLPRDKSARTFSDLPYDMKAEAAPQAPEEVPPGREETVESVRCPICGVRVLGHTEDDLSRSLWEHMSGTHRVAKGIKEILKKERV